MSQDHPLFIDGQARPASDGRTLTLVNPATRQAFGQAAAGTRADVDAAVAAARRELDGGA